MSMNRMYLRCRHCGDKFLLAKAGGIRFEQPFEPVSYSHNLNDFLEQHYECKGRNDVGYDFDICYSDPEWNVKEAGPGRCVPCSNMNVYDIFKEMSKIQKRAVWEMVGAACGATNVKLFNYDLTDDQRSELVSLFGKFMMENNGFEKEDK